MEASVHAAMDARLRRDSPRPLAVALSGGGDSLALTLMADAWARAAGRELLVLTVDHGLSPASAAWTDTCAGIAARLGRPFVRLAWTGEKPPTGLPAKARAARHALLADAARAAGATVILMGHTADDVSEAGAMRAAGASTPDPRDWSPSPAWPEGRGVFLLRPILDVRRADLRAWLARRGESWIEDPANADPRFARARARAMKPEDQDGIGAPEAWPGLVEVANSGLIRMDRGSLTPRRLGLACVCAGGGTRPPRGAALGRAAETLAGTLAGARIRTEGGLVLISREPGEAARGGLAPLALSQGHEAVWDGRFAFVARRPGLVVRRLAGLARRLGPEARRGLAATPALARGGLPAILLPDGEVGCPMLAPIPGVDWTPLVADRLDAARGQVTREPA
jgi:tRNA(Ile)-lysidine synthase